MQRLCGQLLAHLADDPFASPAFREVLGIRIQPRGDAGHGSQREASQLLDGFIEGLGRYQLSQPFHAPQPQPFRASPGQLTIGLRAGAPAMLRAQVLEILQTAHILVKQTIWAPLDHALRRELIHVLANDPEVDRQPISGNQHRPQRLASLAAVTSL